jgi:hypothetical protein
MMRNRIVVSNRQTRLSLIHFIAINSFADSSKRPWGAKQGGGHDSRPEYIEAVPVT